MQRIIDMWDKSKVLRTCYPKPLTEVRTKTQVELKDFIEAIADGSYWDGVERCIGNDEQCHIRQEDFDNAKQYCKKLHSFDDVVNLLCEKILVRPDLVSLYVEPLKKKKSFISFFYNNYYTLKNKWISNSPFVKACSVLFTEEQETKGIDWKKFAKNIVEDINGEDSFNLYDLFEYNGIDTDSILEKVNYDALHTVVMLGYTLMLLKHTGFIFDLQSMFSDFLVWEKSYNRHASSIKYLLSGKNSLWARYTEESLTGFHKPMYAIEQLDELTKNYVGNLFDIKRIALYNADIRCTTHPREELAAWHGFDVAKYLDIWERNWLNDDEVELWEYSDKADKELLKFLRKKYETELTDVLKKETRQSTNMNLNRIFKKRKLWVEDVKDLFEMYAWNDRILDLTDEESGKFDEPEESRFYEYKKLVRDTRMECYKEYNVKETIFNYPKLEEVLCSILDDVDDDYDSWDEWDRPGLDYLQRKYYEAMGSLRKPIEKMGFDLSV